MTFSLSRNSVIRTERWIICDVLRNGMKMYYGCQNMINKTDNLDII